MYKYLNDNEIIYMINESDDYVELLLEKYKPFLTKLCRKYLSYANKVGLELEDLIQIANIGLINCIKYYKNNINTSFFTYMTRCIENNLKTELRKELTYKKRTLNISISLDEVIQGTDATLLDLIKDDKAINPVDYLVIEEKEIEYVNFINSLPFEVAVIFEMKNQGFTSNEISKFLDINKKEINKSMQYARNRLCLSK